MKGTGVFLTETEYEQIKKCLEPTIEMNLETGITITRPGDKEAAWKLLGEFAVAKGLPEMTKENGYGLAANREIVGKD